MLIVIWLGNNNDYYLILKKIFGINKKNLVIYYQII